MFQRRSKLSLTEKLKRAIKPRTGYRRSFTYLFLRLKRLPGTPKYIAKGFAIGVAVNFWPILFTHWIGGYVLCRVLGGDVIAMFLGTMLGNPWTMAIVYPLMYKIGKVLMGMRPHPGAESLDSLTSVWKQIWPIESWHSLAVGFHEIIMPMMLGGFLLGLPCVLISYYLVRNGVGVYRLQRRAAAKGRHV